MPRLYLMRHGKAENTMPDFNRSLSRLGQDNVSNVAKVLSARTIKINQAIYSSASRAKETASLICEDLNIEAENQIEDKRIYNASVSELQAVISEIDESKESVLIVGHNPGLADLVLTLCTESIHLSAGNLAILYAESWKDVRNCKCKLVEKL